MKTTFALILATSLVTACGTKSDSDDNGKKKINTGENNDKTTAADDGTTTTAAIAADEELAGDSISAQIDEAIAAVAEEQSETPSSSLALADDDTSDNENSDADSAASSNETTTSETDADSDQDDQNGTLIEKISQKVADTSDDKQTDKSKRLERFRVCTEDGDKAVVEIKRAVERSWSFEGPVRQGSTEFKHLTEITRTWSRADGSIGCAANGKFADLDRSDMMGVKLEASFKRERSRSASFSNKKRGIELSRSTKFSAEGKRLISWNDVVVADGTITLDKTVSQAVARKLEITNQQGETKTFEHSVSTDADMPLKIVTVRDESTDRVQSRTVVSGKTIATGKDGGRLETSFDNVKYLNGKGCYAVSGKVTGAIYEKDSTEPQVTFTIDFAADGKSITFSNSKEVDYVADGCDFDVEAVAEDAASVEEKSGKADVTIDI